MRPLSVVLTACFLLWSTSIAARAQTIPSVGTGSTFEVATWNIEWFGSSSNGPSDDDLQLDNVVSVIVESDIDLWAVQEIDDANDFATLLERLGDGWEGTLSSSSNFQLGYIYKSDVVTLRQQTELFEDDDDNFAGRPPLLIQADVMLPQDTVRTTIITLHMKAFGDTESYERRDAAATQLKNRLDFFYANEPLIVLGDFNDELTSSISGSKPSPYAEFVDDADDYAFLTMPLDEQNIPTWCSTSSCQTGSTFDHILISDELFEPYEEGSSDRFIELVDSIDRYTFTTSDHLPVYARFRFEQNTAVEMPQPHPLLVQDVYPNPVNGSATLIYETTAAGAVSVSVFDILGREVLVLYDRVETPGQHRLTLDGSDLTPGTYFVRTQTGRQATVTSIVVAR